MTKAVSLEEYSEEADRRIRELPDLPMDFSGMATAPHIPGSLYTAAAGDSISSIMGSSDPGAIGAFMQANDLNGTAIRAGESYIVPERGSFSAPGARALGQQGLDTDNAQATPRMQERPDRSMAAIGNPVRTFDPPKGLLATTSNVAPQGTTNSGRNPSAEKFQQASNSSDIAGKIADLFEIQNAFLGLKDGGRAAAMLGRGSGLLGAALIRWSMVSKASVM